MLVSCPCFLPSSGAVAAESGSCCAWHRPWASRSLAVFKIDVYIYIFCIGQVKSVEDINCRTINNFLNAILTGILGAGW